MDADWDADADGDADSDGDGDGAAAGDGDADADVMIVSTVATVYDQSPVTRDVTWSALARRLTRRPAPSPGAQKTTLPCWIPAEMRPGLGRRLSAVVDVHALVLDYDSGATLDEGRETWREWAHAGHTSWSHTDEHHRYRIVLPLKRPCSARWWPRLWTWAARRSGWTVDRSACDASRLYLLPALQSVTSSWEAWTHAAPVLDLDPVDLPATSAEISQARRARQMAALRARRVRRPQREDADRARLLREDPVTRRDVAVSLGARLAERGAGEIAHGICCPGCGRKSVWFAVAPERAWWARCDHARSCGWTGRLEEL